MNESLDRSFGLIIAFLLPGFTCLAGLSAFSPVLASWLSAEPSRDPTLGGFLYVVLGSLALGLVISAIRWALIDTLHHTTGVKKPELHYARLSEHLLAYQLAVEYTYRYFQFYSNMAVAGLIAAVSYQIANGVWPFFAWVGIVSLELILLAASRDSLKRYYERVSLVLGTRGAVDE